MESIEVSTSRGVSELDTAHSMSNGLIVVRGGSVELLDRTTRKVNVSFEAADVTARERYFETKWVRNEAYYATPLILRIVKRLVNNDPYEKWSKVVTEYVRIHTRFGQINVRVDDDFTFESIGRAIEEAKYNRSFTNRHLYVKYGDW